MLPETKDGTALPSVTTRTPAVQPTPARPSNDARVDGGDCALPASRALGADDPDHGAGVGDADRPGCVPPRFRQFAALGPAGDDGQAGDSRQVSDTRSNHAVPVPRSTVPRSATSAPRGAVNSAVTSFQP